MIDIATPEFLNELQSLYPATAKYLDGDWFLAAAVAFSSSNCPEAVPRVLRYALDALDKLPETSYEDRRLLVRKMRDGLLKSGILSGYPKAINALVSLYEATPEELRDTEPLRDSTRSKEEDAAAGQAYFDLTFGDTTAKIQPMLRSLYPDLEHFVVTVGYGYVYSFVEVISDKETSFATISTMIANGTPSQVEWHLTRAVHHGATVEEARAVREIALRIAIKAGVPLKIEVPNI
ncbi:AhpD-like protein [Suillus clintonianus]|uniref:AhpD-like protein n=1 Tax=Suillus clintonianus TaxID=1904413 RepID=UPI001B88479C|nr:AhpD-like protein [Suillus clintonianus]KAG2144298.1 AhpD-like protein [Suillus clintonianus]